MKSYLYLFFSLILFTSCLSNDNTSFDLQTEEDIIQYLDENNLTATKTDSGLYYIINNEGTGTQTKENAVVGVEYTGSYLDGTVFDDSESGQIFDLSTIIIGLQEGLQLFKEGGDGKLIIPYELAFGTTGNSNIPGGAVLVFDIKVTESDYADENETAILKYIADNNLTATRTASGLYYVVNNLGTGTQPTSESNVTVDYKGYLLDGTVFDPGTEDITTNLSQVIAGWTEGIPYFKEGGDGLLLIPYTLGYGVYGSGQIPAVSVLIFDVSLISVN
jgi:FKBP-type peptidyl-prolyl cis-trans isomerase